MIKVRIDYRLLIGLFLAHLFMYLTFMDHKVFWYMFTASMLILISFSIVSEEIDDSIPLNHYLFLGFISGILLYILFFIGHHLLIKMNISIDDNISKLYKLFSPTQFWHYLVLMLIVVPGEEIFWRGFVQKRLLKDNRFWSSILISALLYASITIYTGEWSLVLASFVAGVFWGGLFAWKRSIPLVIVSHLIFDFFLFILYPL
jgi:uncharacterized protein